MKFIKLIFAILTIISFSCNSAKEARKDYSKIISREFLNSDSLSIVINYKGAEGCLGHFRGRISVEASDKKFYFTHVHYGDTGKTEVFLGENENIIEIIEQFEKNSKKSTKMCGGIAGGTGYYFNMCINNLEETEFSYCQSEYDGLTYLLSSMRKLKTKEIYKSVY